MTRDEIVERARERVVTMLDTTPEKVTEEAKFIEDLGADSLDSIELTMDLEETFDVELGDNDVADADTFGRLVDLIVRKLQAVQVVAA